MHERTEFDATSTLGSGSGCGRINVKPHRDSTDANNHNHEAYKISQKTSLHKKNKLALSWKFKQPKNSMDIRNGKMKSIDPGSCSKL